MKTNLIALLLISVLSLSACMQNMGNKEMMGSATGAVLGGVAGAQFGKGTGQLVGVGLGALLGSMVGGEFGRSLDKADLAYANRAQEQAAFAPVGQQISWNNPQSGNYGTITPTRDGSMPDGRYCREYTQTIVVGGQKQSGVGQACRNPDGSWEIVK